MREEAVNRATLYEKEEEKCTVVGMKGKKGLEPCERIRGNLCKRSYKRKTDYGMTESTEMEFLDINLTKDSSILFHAIHSSFFRRILKVPKREILDRSDFPDFYTIKSLREGDFGVKI